MPGQVDPVIVDDGASIRIRHVRSSAAVEVIDALLDVPQSVHSFPAAVGGFTSMQLVFINSVNGQPTSPNPSPLNPGDKVEIVSNGLTVRMEIGSGAVNTKISIIGTAAMDPAVEAKQSKTSPAAG